MDKKYWNTYYNDVGVNEKPSDFARFCLQNYTNELGRIFDIGCGNGRDSFFFSQNSIPCTGIDQSDIIIDANKIRALKLGLDTHFSVEDFSKCEYDLIAGGPYTIYSRFTLHAINYKEEARLFSHLEKGINLKYLFIEVRSIKDSIYGKGEEVGLHEFITTHYRRFIDPTVLKSKLKENFKIEYFRESQGFAKIEGEDPWILRVIAKKY